jgi:hypothetical protein
MMKKIILITLMTFALSVNSQIVQTEAAVVSGGNSMAFLDGSSSTGYASFPGAGKGILFPSTDVTGLNAGDVFDSGTIGSPSANPNYYDGLVVYNTGTGAVTGTMGNGSPDVAPGFYYYSNPARTAWDGGTWTPLGGGSSSAVAIADGVASDSYATINATQEKVVRLTGISADGTNTTLDLDAALTTAGVAVAKFRKAAIYDTAGDLVMQATGGYTTGTDILVTGNGMMNKLLPAGSYSVEVYYTE